MSNIDTSTTETNPNVRLYENPQDDALCIWEADGEPVFNLRAISGRTRIGSDEDVPLVRHQGRLVGNHDDIEMVIVPIADDEWLGGPITFARELHSAWEDWDTRSGEFGSFGKFLLSEYPIFLDLAGLGPVSTNSFR